MMTKEQLESREAFKDQMDKLGFSEQASVIMSVPFNSEASKEARQHILGNVSMDADQLDMVAKEVAPKVLKNEGGNIDTQMSSLLADDMPEMLPDEEMEEEYLDFILDEALDNEEENYLMEILQSNDRLSEIFDKVIDVAQEFAGSGPVEGPGSGVSDSIPARLSDGEFVFTAKAVEEIGSDNLMSMMKDAEARADERQGLATGGEVDEEKTVVVKGEEPAKQEIRVVKETVNPYRGMADANEIGQAINQQMLLDPDQKHVRS